MKGIDLEGAGIEEQIEKMIEDVAENSDMSEEEIAEQMMDPMSQSFGGLHYSDVLEKLEEYLKMRPDSYRVEIQRIHPDDHHFNVKVKELEFDREKGRFIDKEREALNDRIRSEARTNLAEELSEVMEEEGMEAVENRIQEIKQGEDQ